MGRSSESSCENEVDDHGTDDATVQTRVKFIEGNEYGNNWDYFEYKNQDGFVTIEQYPDSQEIVVYTAFEPNEDTFNVKESAVTASDYFNIRINLLRITVT